MKEAVAFVLKGYPRLSETFIAQEIRTLEQRGLNIEIISLRHPTDKLHHPVHGEIQARVNYLPEYLYQEPLRVWRGWRKARKFTGYRQARRHWLADLWRDFTPNRVRRFGQALVLATELPENVTALHAHFLHTPASVTRYAAEMRALPWSCSAHAKDIWTSPDWEIREKIAAMGWLTTCSRAAAEQLRSLAAGQGAKIMLAYHGLDLSRFPPAPEAAPTAPDEVTANAVAPKAVVKILLVGRAVFKKGINDVLAALAILPADREWRFIHIGGGPLRDDLMKKAAQLGLSDRIEWRGAQSQQDVLAAYREADIFVLASRIAADGDRDGLPNVLLEAASQSLAMVATRVSAIPEFIIAEETGLLLAPEDPPALARALDRLILDPAARARLGAAARRRLTAEFSHDACIGELAAAFGLAAPSAAHDEPVNLSGQKTARR